MTADVKPAIVYNKNTRNFGAFPEDEPKVINDAKYLVSWATRAQREHCHHYPAPHHRVGPLHLPCAGLR